MERLRRVLPTPSFLLPLSFLLLLTEAFVPATLSPPSNALAARRGSFVATPSRASVGTDLGASDGFSGNGGIPPPLTNTGDPFAILGIDRSEANDPAAIKRAYHRQAKAYQPDPSFDEATRQRIESDFQLIIAAYETIAWKSGESATSGRRPGQQDFSDDGISGGGDVKMDAFGQSRGQSARDRRAAARTRGGARRRRAHGEADEPTWQSANGYGPSPTGSPSAYGRSRALPALPPMDDYARDMEMHLIKERTTARNSAYDDWLYEVARMGGGGGERTQMGGGGSGSGGGGYSGYGDNNYAGSGGGSGSDGGAAAAASMDPASVPLVPFVPPPGGWAYPGAPEYVPQDQEDELYNAWSGRG